MRVEHWDGDHLCGDTGFKDTDYTPEEVLENSYDVDGVASVVWGAYRHKINNVQWFDPDKKDYIIVHLEDF